MASKLYLIAVGDNIVNRFDLYGRTPKLFTEDVVHVEAAKMSAASPGTMVTVFAPIQGYITNVQPTTSIKL